MPLLRENVLPGEDPSQFECRAASEHPLNASRGLAIPLSATPVDRLQRRLAVVCAAASLAAFAVLAAFARVPLAPLPAFIPSYEASLIVIDLITAVLLFGQFAQQRSAGLLALIAGYLFDALMIVPHMLTFPGVLSATGGLGAGVHTTAWLYMFWHGGFPIFVIAYAWLNGPAEAEGAGLRTTHDIAAIAAVVALCALLTLLAINSDQLLPAVMAGNADAVGQKIAAVTVWGITAAALLALLARRSGSVLDLWLIVVVVAWLADIGLSAVFDAARFDLGFYAGRAYGLLAASFVLIVLLAETAALHRRLAAATTRLDAAVRERTGELALTNRQLNAILESSPVAIFMLDLNGAVRLWTASAERLFGYSAQEALGRRPPYLGDDELAEFEANIALAEAGTAPGCFEAQHRRCDGTLIDLSISWARVHDEAARLLGIMYAATDITDRKRLEAQLRQAQKMEALGNLTGGMAHDFNNHLGVIILNLDLLREQVADNADAEELTDEALSAAMRGAELIRHLLAFARRQPLQPQRADVNRLVGEMARLLERVLGEEISVSVETDAAVWPTVIDPAQLESSLANLANNARDAMPDGGELRIATGNRTLDADYAAEHADVAAGDYVLVEISDTGIGMTPEVLAQVFDPFFTTKPQGQGTGLGLSMVYGFIKQSGGHINVYSEPGIGTTVRLYLPRAKPAEAKSETVDVQPPVRGSGETVLIVEDNESMRRVAVRQLTDLGYCVIEAENAHAALEVLERNPADLLFSDVVMPHGMNGYELVRIARQRRPGLKALMTSGFPGRMLTETRDHGGIRLLSKPYRRDDLSRAIQEVLQASVAEEGRTDELDFADR